MRINLTKEDLTMRTKGTKIVLALLVLALLPALVMAQAEKPVRVRGERPGAAWWKNEKIQKEMGLSEKQVAAIDAKMGKIQEQAGDIAPNLRTANKELDELFTKDEINVDAIHKKADQRGKLLTKMAKVTLDRRLAVATVLDPKQRERAAQLLERPALAKEQGKGEKPQAQRLRAAAAGAGLGLEGEWWKRERIQKALGLTEEQVTAIGEKMGDGNKEAREIRPKMAAARGELADLFKAEQIDAKEIRKVGGEIDLLERSLDKLNIERRIIIAQNLKPEQRVKLAEMKKTVTQQQQEGGARIQKRDAKEAAGSGDKVRAKVRKGAGK
jgi:Spy/CpxP family protein refolding chaperone